MVDVVIPLYRPDAKTGILLRRLLKQDYEINRIILINTEKEYFNEELLYNTGNRGAPYDKDLNLTMGSTNAYGYGIIRCGLCLIPYNGCHTSRHTPYFKPCKVL